MIETIKSVLKTKAGKIIFVASAAIFFGLNYFLNELYVPGFQFIIHLPVRIFVPYLAFSFFNIILVGISMALAYNRVKQLRGSGMLAGSGISLVGSFFGLLSGACPACVAGLFPMIMGLIGQSTVTLVAFPLYGLELQILSTFLMMVGIYFLTRPLVCNVK